MGAACSKQPEAAKTEQPSGSSVAHPPAPGEKKVYTEPEVKSLCTDTDVYVIAGGRVFHFPVATLSPNHEFVKSHPGADVSDAIKEKNIELADLEQYRVGFLAPPDVPTADA